MAGEIGVEVQEKIRENQENLFRYLVGTCHVNFKVTFCRESPK